jgi:HAD superfamily hydrolase (TIGR01509 family)
MRRHVGVPLPPAQINAAVLARVQERYRHGLPWIDGAREALVRIAERWPVALATSSNREVIDLVIDEGDLGAMIAVAVSSEEVPAGKPAPDVYLEATRRLGADPTRCAAIEDSTNGMRAALAAGMTLLAVPNTHFPPDPQVLGRAAAVLRDVGEVPAALDLPS